MSTFCVIFTEGEWWVARLVAHVSGVPIYSLESFSSPDVMAAREYIRRLELAELELEPARPGR